jgi:hypothetical protein
MPRAPDKLDLLLSKARKLNPKINPERQQERLSEFRRNVVHDLRVDSVFEAFDEKLAKRRSQLESGEHLRRFVLLQALIETSNGSPPSPTQPTDEGDGIWITHGQ